MIFLTILNNIIQNPIPSLFLIILIILIILVVIIVRDIIYKIIHFNDGPFI